MAKSKGGAESPDKRSAAAKSSAVKDTTPSAPRVERAKVQVLASSLPTLNDAQRKAFRDKRTDKACQALGARTRAGVVEYEAARFLKVAHEFLQGARPRKLRYTPLRLAFFAECLLALIDARAADVAERDAKASKKRSSVTTAQRAQELAGELSEALRGAVEGFDARTRELTDALALASPPSDPVAVLDALVRVLSRWLDASDPMLAACLAGAGIDREDLADARATADTHRREREGAQGTGNVHVDGPAVNTAEGRVLYEMRHVRAAFHSARERLQTNAIPRLDPSPRLQRVLNALLDTSEEEDIPVPPTDDPQKPA